MEESMEFILDLKGLSRRKIYIDIYPKLWYDIDKEKERRIKMTCISDHAKVLLIYYEVLNEWEDIDEFYKEQSDAEKRAEEFARESNTDFFTIVYEVRVIQDDKRIYTMSYSLKHF